VRGEEGSEFVTTHGDAVAFERCGTANGELLLLFAATVEDELLRG
jgi:hypothetical protein